ncbi:lipoprotein, partial [Candidatus Endoriftia persephone str. Guaymas]|nr:lipoprotein [Candidatus Endoriftia persephone str. Guaymas]
QPTGEQRIEPQSLQVLRQLIYSGTEELGRRNEAALVQQEMRRNLAGQILRHLQARL